MDRAEVDAAKANLYEGYKATANLVRDRTAAIQDSYNDIQADITNNATRRTAENDQIGAAQQGGMDTAAKALGLNFTPSVGRSRDYMARDEERYGNAAEGWKTFLETAKNAQAGRNWAVGDAFENQGAASAQELENLFLRSLMSGSGGYGGGGSGGGRGGRGGSGSSSSQYPNRVSQMDPGVARGLAATQIRLTGQAQSTTPQQFTSAMQKLISSSKPAAQTAPASIAKPTNPLAFWSK